MRSDFVVIGAGLLGLSAAWALAKRGHEVTVIDEAPTGHADGGSHGSCRIFRLGYETASYVRLARQAREIWTELEDASGERLLSPTPQLTFGPEMDQVAAALAKAGAPAEVLSDRDAVERFGGITVSGPVLYEASSAVIAADRTLTALDRLAGSTGRELARVTGLAELGSGVRVTTTSGEIDADRVIVCAGALSAKLVLGAGIVMPSAASMEQVSYLAPTTDTGPMPIFVHYGGVFPYGLPVPGTDRYKIGLHFGGPPVDPERQDHSVNAGLVAQMRLAAAEFLPNFDPDPVATERCIYDNSPDTDFIVDRIGSIVIGSGTSGHGFKFGPLIGEWLAALATGDDAGAPPPSFALSRF